MTDANDEIDISARKILEMLANSARLGPNPDFDLLEGNNFGGLDLTVDQGEEFDQDDIGPYILGLLTPAIIMFVFILIWFGTLCCGSKCFGVCYERSLCKAFFFFCLFWSTMGWLISFKGINTFVAGFDDGFNAGSQIIDLLESTAKILNQLVDEIPVFENAIANMQSVCSGGGTVDTISSSSLGFDSAINFNGNEIAEFENEIDLQKIRDDVRPYTNAIRLGYILLILMVLGYMFSFLFVSAVGYYNEKRDGSKKEHIVMPSVDQCHKGSGLCFFGCCGVFISLLAIIFASILAFIATAGADQCVPTVSEKVLDLLAESINLSPNEDLCLINLDPPNDSDKRKTAQIACHYIRCVGENQLFEEIGLTEVNGELQLDVFNDVLQELENNKDDILQEAVNNGTVDEALCEAQFDNVVASAEAIFDIAIEAINNFRCQNVAPIVNTILNRSFCGVFAGLGIIYVTWYTGAILLMIGLTVYCVLNNAPGQKKKMEMFGANQGAIPVATASGTAAPQSVKVDVAEPTATPVVVPEADEKS